MWPRLRQITVLVSVLAAFFGLLWQIKQFRKECPPDQSLPACTICSLLPNEACETDQREDDAAWAAAVRQSTPAGYRDYNLRWPHGRHRPEAAARLRELDERSWARLGRGGIPELRAYLSEWSPDGAHVSEATNRISELEDDDAWSVASGAGSPEAYWQYLNHPWTRHGVQAHKRLDELSEAEWEREIKNSDSEEVIESFINKYKVGSYITLAQERLKVAGAWTPIKNTTDPQVLFDFLSYYHDPIFEKLARNLLQIIDDQAWQLALKKGTRDAFEAYVKKWSAFRPPGRYVEDAENKLNELERYLFGTLAKGSRD